MQKIEIYIRKSGERTLLNIYLPTTVREQFLEALQLGSFEERATEVAVELSVLPEWITDPKERAAFTAIGMHLRVPVSAVNLITEE